MWREQLEPDTTLLPAPSPAPAPLDAGLLLGARVIVGAAGYNLTYEALALGRWHVALPRPRRFDDQRRRAQALALVPRSPIELERVVVRLARSAAPRESATVVREVDELAVALLDRERRVRAS
ncbi:MAG: hypothetical protein H6713_26765 [Myxococcales bacterium]|nr:hypothetical protein [Myxococcales bacterium]